MSLTLTAVLLWVIGIAFAWICAFGRKTGRLASKGCMIEREKAPTQFRLTLIAYDTVTIASLVLAMWCSWCIIAK